MWIYGSRSRMQNVTSSSEKITKRQSFLGTGLKKIEQTTLGSCTSASVLRLRQLRCEIWEGRDLVLQHFGHCLYNITLRRTGFVINKGDLGPYIRNNSIRQSGVDESFHREMIDARIAEYRRLTSNTCEIADALGNYSYFGVSIFSVLRTDTINC